MLTNSFIPYNKAKNAVYITMNNPVVQNIAILQDQKFYIYEETYIGKYTDMSEENLSIQYMENLVQDGKYTLKYIITNFDGYFYGYDSGSKISGGIFHSNTILICLPDNKYLLLDEEISVFSSEEKILDYISLMGNNTVPYPVAYTENYVYFMLDFIGIPKNKLKLKANIKNAEALYGEFYNTNLENTEHIQIEKIDDYSNIDYKKEEKSEDTVKKIDICLDTNIVL
jgi:hypothetical protein